MITVHYTVWRIWLFGINPHNVSLTYSLPSKSQRFALLLWSKSLSTQALPAQWFTTSPALRNAEHALQLSEERYHAGSGRPELNWSAVFCPTDGLIFVTRSYCRFFGKTREELLNSSFHSLDSRRRPKNRVDAYLIHQYGQHPSITYEHRVINSSVKFAGDSMDRSRYISKRRTKLNCSRLARDILTAEISRSIITRLSHLNLVAKSRKASAMKSETP